MTNKRMTLNILKGYQIETVKENGEVYYIIRKMKRGCKIC